MGSLLVVALEVLHPGDSLIRQWEPVLLEIIWEGVSGNGYR